jgi:uncharacterized membrane protein
MLRANNQRAKSAILLVVIVTIITVVLLIIGFVQLNTYQNPNYSITDVNTNDLIEGATAIIYMIFYIISAVTFIQWFRRAYFNLHTQVEVLSFQEGWAAGAWFVPIMNLGRPYIIMKELYNVTNKLLDGNPNIIKPLSIANVNLWWTLWIITAIINQVSFRFARNASTVDQLTTSTVIDIISSLLAIPLGLITIKIIKDYSYFESIMNKDSVVKSDENLLDSQEFIK